VTGQAIIIYCLVVDPEAVFQVAPPHDGDVSLIRSRVCRRVKSKYNLNYDGQGATATGAAAAVSVAENETRSKWNT